MVPGSIPSDATGFLGDTSLPTIPWPWGRLSRKWKWAPGTLPGGKGDWYMGLTNPPTYVPNVMEIWEPKPPGTFWATLGLLRDCFTLHTQSGPQKCVHTLIWKILLYNRNYCMYTKAKLIWEMSLNFGFNVGVRSGHHRHPNTVEAAELLQACIHFFWATLYICTHIQKRIYRMSQEECARLWEGVPYVKVYRYNPKHLCPKLNGYGYNGQRSLKLWQLLHTYWLPNTY